MRTVIWCLVTLGGAIAWWRWGGGPAALAWVAVCAAFAFTARKLTWSDALRLWFIVIGFLVLLLGGMVVLESSFGGFAAGLWFVICLVLFLVLRRKFVRLVPMLHLTTTFDEVLKEKGGETDRSSSALGCLGFFGFLAGMILFIALWGTAGGAAWFALFFVLVLAFMAADRHRRPSSGGESDS